MLTAFKHFLIEKFLLAKLMLGRKKQNLTNFGDYMQKVGKILIILPVNKESELSDKTFVKKVSDIFETARINTFDLNMLRKSDINWLGVPNNAFLNNIRDENYDLLIDINPDHNKLCCYLDALSEAEMRIHLAQGKFDSIFNLQIRSDSDIPLNSKYDTLLNYLKVLRQN